MESREQILQNLRERASEIRRELIATRGKLRLGSDYQAFVERFGPIVEILMRVGPQLSSNEAMYYLALLRERADFLVQDYELATRIMSLESQLKDIAKIVGDPEISVL